MHMTNKCIWPCVNVLTSDCDNVDVIFAKEQARQKGSKFGVLERTKWLYIEELKTTYSNFIRHISLRVTLKRYKAHTVSEFLINGSFS